MLKFKNPLPAFSDDFSERENLFPVTYANIKVYNLCTN